MDFCKPVGQLQLTKKNKKNKANWELKRVVPSVALHPASGIGLAPNHFGSLNRNITLHIGTSRYHLIMKQVFKNLKKILDSGLSLSSTHIQRFLQLLCASL